MSPKASIAVISYNHEAFIEQALRSILEQITDFPFEVVIGDDCSTDQTPAIIQSYALRYPETIRVLQRAHNLGAIANVIDTEANCRGQYIAWLEGDDYWLDPAKLQKQVDYLDARSECEVCFGNAREVYANAIKPDGIYKPKIAKDTYTLRDILDHNFIPSCTIVHHNRQPIDYPDWFSRLPQGDWSRIVLLARRGLIGYLPEILAVRRLHSAGLWGGQSHSQRLQKIIESYTAFRTALGEPYSVQIDGLIEKTYLRLAVDLEKHGQRQDALAIFHQHFQPWLATSRLSRWALFKLMIKFCIPQAFTNARA